MSIREETRPGSKQAHKRWRRLATTGERARKEYQRAQKHETGICPFCRATVSSIGKRWWRTWKCDRCGYRFWGRKSKPKQRLP